MLHQVDILYKKIQRDVALDFFVQSSLVRYDRFSIFDAIASRFLLFNNEGGQQKC